MTNSERFGSLDLPVPDPAGGPVSDPCLATIASFLKDVINAKGTAGWRVVSSATSVPVKAIFTHNPEEASFQADKLPALFVYREAPERESRFIADDYLVSTDRVMVLWVFPLQIQEKEKLRSPFVNALTKIASARLLMGRDPAWKVVGDTEPQAVANGSFLLSYAGLFEAIVIGKWALRDVAVTAGEKVIPYAALALPIVITERYVPPDSPAFAGVTATQETKDTPPFVLEQMQLNP